MHGAERPRRVQKPLQARGRFKEGGEGKEGEGERAGREESRVKFSSSPFLW